MHDVSVMVGENLHLDVPRPLDQPLDVERAVAERRRRLAPRALHRLGDVPRVQHAPHAFAASTGGCLDQRGKPDPVDGPANPFVGLVVGVSPGTTGTPADCIKRRASILDPMRAMTVDGGPTKMIAGVFARLGEAGVLREEAVARVHGIRLGRFDGPQDVRNGKVAVASRGGPNATARSAAATCGARASASEYTATLSTPSSRHASDAHRIPVGDLANDLGTR